MQISFETQLPFICKMLDFLNKGLENGMRILIKGKQTAAASALVHWWAPVRPTPTWQSHQLGAQPSRALQATINLLLYLSPLQNTYHPAQQLFNYLPDSPSRLRIP